MKWLASTLGSVVVEQPKPTEEAPQHQWFDKGSGIAGCHWPGMPHYPAKRWAAEGTLAWLSSCRVILVYFDKKASKYLALIKLTCVVL
jgi:hypothetical protein